MAKFNLIRTRLKIIFLVFFSVGLTLALVELTSYLMLKHDIYFDSHLRPYRNNHRIKEIHCFDSDLDNQLGYRNKKNYQEHARKMFLDGQIIYDVEYLTDQFRRRTVGQKYLPGNPHLILFGDSNIFGVGLEDQETLQYMIVRKMPGYNVYNYAVHAYGPQQMLAQLQDGRLDGEVSSKEGIAVYFFIPYLINRAVGGSGGPWAFRSPCYYLSQDGQLQRKGLFETGRPIISALYRIYDKLKSKSFFLKLINLNFPVKITKQHIELTCEIINQSKKEYEKQFNGIFYVSIDPLYQEEKLTNQVAKILKEKGVKLLRYPAIGNGKRFLIADDGHYNAAYNRLISEKLVNALKIIDKEKRLISKGAPR